MSEKEHSTDAFLQIAQRVQEEKSGLVEPQPVPADHDRRYELKAGAEAVCLPSVPRNTAWFNEELARLREKWKPFLANHAPAVESSRQRTDLIEFEWRVDSEECPDRLPDAFSGAGEWDTVRVPHYGPPIGRAKTFYRKVLSLDPVSENRRVWLHFEGVDYIATVYVNGSLVGRHEGFFAPFEFDVTDHIRPDADNILLVQVDNDAICMGNDMWDSQEAGDKIYAATGPGWDEPEIGWHHCPPGMGIYRKVWLETRPEVFIADGWVRPLPGESAVELWLEVHTPGTAEREMDAAIAVFGRNFNAEVLPVTKVALAGKPGAGRNDYRVRLPIESDKRWTTESPWLHALHVRVGRDKQEFVFGLRDFRMETEAEPRGRLFLNGLPVRLRGVNTMGHEQQCVMRGDLDQLLDDLLIYKMAGVNYIRFTQRPVEREVYQLCDALGLMAQADLPLFKNLRRNQFHEAVRQCSEMERFVRRHPCVVMASFINEPFPLEWHNALHRHLGKNELHAFFTSASTAVLQENPDRVIKPVDGDYDPPSPGLPDNHCYTLWYNGHGIPFGKLEAGYWQAVKPGWLYACGEYGAEGLDPADLMRRRYPTSWLPQNAGEEKTWTPTRIRKAQSGDMYQVFYDRPNSLTGWVDASQEFQAWAVGNMTQAFRRDPRMVSFALHLGIDAFPSGWMKAVIDCERKPKKAFFSFRDALTPVLPSLRAPRRFWWDDEVFEAELWIANDWSEQQVGLELRAELFRGETRVATVSDSLTDVPPCEAAGIGKLTYRLPAIDNREAFTLRTQVVNQGGDLLGESTFTFDVFAPIDKKPSGTFLSELTEEMVKDAKAGGTVVCGPLPCGTYDVGGLTFEIMPIGMGELTFCSRATGHPLVAGFHNNDFRLWFDEKKGYASDCADSVLVGEDWNPVLLAGRGGFGEMWTPAPVVAEKPVGEGRIVVSQLKLENRIASNPPAALFALRLMDAIKLDRSGGEM